MEHCRHLLLVSQFPPLPTYAPFLARQLEWFLSQWIKSCHTAQVPAMALGFSLREAKALLMSSRLFMISLVLSPFWPHLLLILPSWLHPHLLSLICDACAYLHTWSWLFLCLQMLFPKHMKGLPLDSFESLLKSLEDSWGLSWSTYLKLQALPLLQSGGPLSCIILFHSTCHLSLFHALYNLFDSILLFVCISPLILVSSSRERGLLYSLMSIPNVYNCAWYAVDLLHCVQWTKEYYCVPGTANHYKPHFNLRGLTFMGLKCPRSHS